MSVKRCGIVATLLCCMLFCAGSALAGSQKQYRVGYLEGGDYWIFSHTFEAVKTALQEQGWKDRIEFVPDAFISPGWDKGPKVWKAKADELMARKDLDLIIAMGGDATKALLEANNHTTPIMGMGISDPLKSDLITSNTDSGAENFSVRIVPGRYKRMFVIFHEVIGFNKLGLIYPDTESGKAYTNLEDAKEVAKDDNFEILEYKLPEETVQATLKGLQTLIDQGMDAFFIPSLLCFDWNKSDVQQIFSFLQKHKIPTFARNGSKDVQAGALMGFSTVDFSTRGTFLANKIIRILKGESPHSLPMIDDGIPKITMNIFVAEKIGFNPPFDILAASDEIYQEIILPEKRLIK